ncbi:MAG: PAS domain S-box protein, partial [Chloroflexota bacterium]|nr:PAS domain S-box protein [Chloroflexota bacterium]
MKPKRILLVEDERIVAEDIRLTLESLGYAVSAVVSSAEEAVAHAAKDKPDLVLMDIMLQGKMNGIEAADQIHSRYGIPIVYLTAYVDEEILQRSKITEPYGYIIKPFQEKELHSAVEMALYKSEAEKALQASEEKYRVLFESSPFLLAQHDKDGRFLLPNPAMAKAVGFPREKLAGRKISEVFPEEVAQPRMKRIRKALDEWQTQVFEDEAGGRHFHNIFVPLRIPGKEDTIQVIAQDITRQKKMEQEIAIQRAHLSSIFEYSREGMVTLGKGDTILEANKGFQDIYGYTIEEIRGKRLDDLIVPERFKEEGKTLDQRALARFATYETIRKRKDGTEINVSLSAGPIKVAGETTGLFVIFR